MDKVHAVELKGVTKSFGSNMANKNIDLFVGGHSHTFLEEMAMHPNLDGVLTPIVQVGEMGVYFGQIDYRK